MRHEIEDMHLDGCLCLDFVNTVYSRTEMPIDDYLYHYGEINIANLNFVFIFDP